MSAVPEVEDKVYAVVFHTDWRKNNSIRIEFVTSDLELAKRVAFHHVSKQIEEDDDYIYKIAENYRQKEHYVEVKGRVIVDYMAVALHKPRIEDKDKKTKGISHTDDNVWAVVEVGAAAIDAIGGIDESLLLR
jgi:hypothetical protein